MTNTEAQAQAQRLYGYGAQAEINKDGYPEVVLGEPSATWKGWPPRLILGFGSTWEGAFEYAEEQMNVVRDAFEKWYEPAANSQLRLF